MMKRDQYMPLIAAIFLFGALFGERSYSYFQMLRWAVTITALATAIDAYRDKDQPIFVIMAAIAILFNPFAPIEFSQKTGKIIHSAACICFVICLVKNYRLRKIIKFRMRPQRKMTAAEKEFHDQVLLQVLFRNGLCPQFYVENEDGSQCHSIDYAIIFTNGTKIGVELDGFGQVKNMPLQGHNKQVMSWSDLERLGWSMYRFTWQQFRTDKQYCIKTLKEVVQKALSK